MEKTILLVEDEKDIRYLTKIRLKKAGYKVLEAPTVQLATALITKKRPDLILLDLLLLGGRGEALCKQLKSDNRFKKTPVILFTATGRDIKQKIRETGADDGILKPFEPAKLLKKIRKFIK